MCAPAFFGRRALASPNGPEQERGGLSSEADFSRRSVSWVGVLGSAGQLTETDRNHIIRLHYWRMVGEIPQSRRLIALQPHSTDKPGSINALGKQIVTQTEPRAFVISCESLSRFHVAVVAAQKLPNAMSQGCHHYRGPPMYTSLCHRRSQPPLLVLSSKRRKIWAYEPPPCAMQTP